MSHFTVMVVGVNPAAQLQPFHEFECTGNDDEYVVEQDRTADAREDWETKTLTRVVLPSGEVLSDYDDRFYRVPTDAEKKTIGPITGTGCGQGLSWCSKDWKDGMGYQTRVRDLSVIPGAKEIDMPAKQVYPNVAEYLEAWRGVSVVKACQVPVLQGDHKYGYAQLNAAGDLEKVVRRTNPNAQWDWYRLGGRWRDYFTLKSGGFADSARIQDIDFEAMQRGARTRARTLYTSIALGMGGSIPRLPKTWERVQEESDNIEQARESYHAQPEVREFKDVCNKLGRHFESLSDWQLSEDEYVEQAALSAIPTFALIKDGQWYERGGMGWWACVSDEKDIGDWAKEFLAHITRLPQDTVLSVYDCHI